TELRRAQRPHVEPPRVDRSLHPPPGLVRSLAGPDDRADAGNPPTTAPPIRRDAPSMKILATGAAGMLGTSLVPTFVTAGHDVVATDIDLTNPTPWGPGAPTIDWLDVRDRSAIKAAFESVQPDLLLHLAAETSLEASDADPDHAFLTNTVATKYLAL